jgi:integrase
MGKLNAAKLRTLTSHGVYGDGDGLYLQVRDAERRTWIYRFTLDGKPRWMGLGSFDDVSLAEARDAVAEARKKVRAGTDPIDERRVAKEATRAGLNTFSEVADAYIAAHEASWRNAKHRQQWRNTLDTYAAPVLGKLQVSKVDTGAVMRVLEPIWREKTETASRLRGRIESILDYAKARGWRDGENPARWRGHMANLLPARSKIAQVEHHPALPWREIGVFMASLRDEEGVAALALRFAILTATRTGEAIGAMWSEIDVGQALWTIPAKRMKAGREHRVPLSDAALAVLTESAKLRKKKDEDGPAFPGSKVGKPLSNMALLMLLRRMQRSDLTAHGFRSTFRDWCAEATNYPREVAEAALAHTLRDKTEAAYQRGDMMEKRRRLMAEWASFCGRRAPIGDVVPLYASA